MTGNCLGLVADDARLSSVLVAYFKRFFGQVGVACGYDTALDHVGPDTNGVLVAAVSTPEHLTAATRLAQTLSLRRLPPHLFIAAAEECRHLPELSALDPYISGRCFWPGDECSAYRSGARTIAPQPAISGNQ